MEKTFIFAGFGGQGMLLIGKFVAMACMLDGKGFSLVEIVTSCPTNWGLEPLEALGFLEEKMFKEFPLGVIRDKDKEGA